jgi:hypothetical protein
LRLLQRLHLAAAPDRAAVDHRRPEKELEELVGDVVVVADGAGVALLAVALAARAQLGGGPRRRLDDPHRPHGGQHQRPLVGAVERGRLPAVEDPDHLVDVVDLELAADVGAAEPQLSRRPQRVSDRAG